MLIFLWLSENVLFLKKEGADQTVRKSSQNQIPCTGLKKTWRCKVAPTMMLQGSRDTFYPSAWDQLESVAPCLTILNNHLANPRTLRNSSVFGLTVRRRCRLQSLRETPTVKPLPKQTQLTWLQNSDFQQQTPCLPNFLQLMLAHYLSFRLETRGCQKPRPLAQCVLSCLSDHIPSPHLCLRCTAEVWRGGTKKTTSQFLKGMSFYVILS